MTKCCMCFTIKHSGNTSNNANTNQKSHNNVNGPGSNMKKYDYHGNRVQAWQPTQNKVLTQYTAWSLCVFVENML